MTVQGKPAQILRVITGSIFAAPGTVLLLGNLDALATRWRAVNGATAEQGLGLLSSVILAASFTPHQLFHSVVHLLGPALLLVLAGGVLLWDASSKGGGLLAREDRCDPINS
jgi:hypothetical protein